MTPTCFVCTAYDVCKGREEIGIAYLMFSYWKDRYIDDLSELLASKCKHYNFIGEEEMARRTKERPVSGPT